ncbi:MAG: glycosyltransferase [Thermodesulfobacteriota bacterium]
MKISVCIATFNGEKYIYDQVKSIIDQLGENDEIVVSDDSSTDRTLEIIKNFNDKRIKIFPGNTFFNPVYNFENAIKQAVGEIIVLSDQDDIWLENKLDVIRRYFQNKTESLFTIVLDGQIIDERGKVIEESIFRMLKSGKGIIKNIIRNTYMGCCMAFSRRVINVILPFPPKIPMHDTWIGLLSELNGVVDFIPEKTLLKRSHKENRSLRSFDGFQMIKWRFYLICYLLLRKGYIHDQ